VVASNHVAFLPAVNGGVSRLYPDDPSQPPQSHTTAINRSAAVGFITDEVATDLEELWNENRAHTYYQNGMATKERANSMITLAVEMHSQVVNLTGHAHECICD
jgi:hypothetical protein